MRNYFILFISVILFYSCGSTMRDSWNHFPKQVDLEKYNNLDFIKVRQGSTVTVKMEENPSTGYSWNYESQKDCSVSVEIGDFEQGSNSDNMVGVPGTRIFEIKGNNMGSCLVEFQQFAPGDSETVVNRKGIYFIVE